MLHNALTCFSVSDLKIYREDYYLNIERLSLYYSKQDPMFHFLQPAHQPVGQD